MPVQGGVEAAFRAELEAAPPDERAALKAKLAQRFDALTSIWRTVERFGVEEVVDPRETGRDLDRLLRLAYALQPADRPRTLAWHPRSYLTASSGMRIW